MHYTSKLHPFTHLVKSVLGTLMFPLSGYPQRPGDLLVLNLHSTPYAYLDGLRGLLDLLGKHFSLESASFIDTFYDGRGTTIATRPAVVFTFDDGLRNNLQAAAVLEEYGIRGLFFTVPDFFQLPDDQQEPYYRAHIRRIINPHYDHQPEDFCALRTDELKALVARGHIVGSHSMSHTMSKEQDEHQLQREIVQSKEVLDQLLQQETMHFCAPFNSLQSVSETALQMIGQHYRFFHSTFAGSNAEEKNPLFVKRVNVEPFWLHGAVKYACSRREWGRWKTDIETFNKLNTINKS